MYFSTETVSERVYAAGFSFDIQFGLGAIEDRSRSLDMDILYQAAFPSDINTAIVFVTLGGDYLSTVRPLTSIAGQAWTYADGGGAASTACEFAATASLPVDHNIHLAVGAPVGRPGNAAGRTRPKAAPRRPQKVVVRSLSICPV